MWKPLPQAGQTTSTTVQSALVALCRDREIGEGADEQFLDTLSEGSQKRILFDRSFQMLRHTGLGNAPDSCLPRINSPFVLPSHMILADVSIHPLESHLITGASIISCPQVSHFECLFYCFSKAIFL